MEYSSVMRSDCMLCVVTCVFASTLDLDLTLENAGIPTLRLRAVDVGFFFLDGNLVSIWSCGQGRNRPWSVVCGSPFFTLLRLRAQELDPRTLRRTEGTYNTAYVVPTLT